MTLPTTNQLQADAQAKLREILAEVIGPHVRWGTEGAPVVIERTAERIVREFGQRAALVTALEINQFFAQAVGQMHGSLDLLHTNVFPEPEVPWASAGPVDLAQLRTSDGTDVPVDEDGDQSVLPDELLPQVPRHYVLEVQDGSLGSSDNL